MGHRFVGQRRAMGIIGSAAGEVFLDFECGAAIVVHPIDHARHFMHHFGTDAVARQHQNFFV